MAEALDVVHFFRDNAGEWRWHRISANRVDIVSDSAEGYNNYSDARDEAMRQFGDDVEYVNDEEVT